MKTPIKFLYLLIGIFFFTYTSCQDEVIEETLPNQQEIIQSDSNLAILMRNTSSNNGSVDDLMDYSDCFTVNLPVTIIANGITITIESIDDLSLLEAIFNASNTDDDDLEFLFPITIILNDYTEINIESVEALNDFIDTCITNENIIECVDFVYPISFSIYNTDFQIIDTVIIDNDYELYIFLEGLEDGNNGVVLASLNFPVSMHYVNGETIEVFNNQELEDAINAATENCDTTCSEEFIVNILQECIWNIVSYNGDNQLIEYDLNFKGHDSLQVTTANFDIIEANWEMSSGNTGLPELVISNFIEDVNGSWIVDECDNDRFVLTQQAGSGVVEMVLEQDCTVDLTPFDCFAHITVSTCDYDNDGIGVFELETLVLGNVLCNVDFTPSFHETLMDAESNMNAIVQPNSYTNTASPQTIYLRIEADNGNFEIFEIELVTEDCSSNCSELDVDNYLQECIWNVVNFNGDDHLIMYDFDFVSNTEVIITGNGLTITSFWSTSQSASGVVVEFTNVAGPNIQVITGSWLVVECAEGRLQFESLNNTDVMVMERDCTTCNNSGVLTNDLIIYMPFGNEVKDLISGEVVPGFTFLTEDRSGNATCAVSFDGNTNFSIPVTAQNQLVQGDSFSISVWFKMQNTDIGNLELFFRKPGNATVGFQLGVYDLNTPLFFDNLNTSLWDNDWNQELDVVWDNTDWHHLVVTVDSNNTVRIYRDGILRNIDENSDLSIGSDPTSQYLLGEGFQGHLDDLRVYKRTLSPNEVGDLYNLEADCFQCL